MMPGSGRNKRKKEERRREGGRKEGGRRGKGVCIPAKQVGVSGGELAQPARQVHELVELVGQVTTGEYEVHSAEGRAAELHAVVRLVVQHLEFLQSVLPEHIQRALHSQATAQHNRAQQKGSVFNSLREQIRFYCSAAAYVQT